MFKRPAKPNPSLAITSSPGCLPTFAAGRFPDWALVDMMPCMDGAELSAQAMVCGASIPTFTIASERGDIFGQAVWDIVVAYSLEGCFEYVERAYAIKRFMIVEL